VAWTMTRPTEHTASHVSEVCGAVSRRAAAVVTSGLASPL
jgi:hypothetical protein